MCKASDFFTAVFFLAHLSATAGQQVLPPPQPLPSCSLPSPVSLPSSFPPSLPPALPPSLPSVFLLRGCGGRVW